MESFPTCPFTAPRHGLATGLAPTEVRAARPTAGQLFSSIACKRSRLDFSLSRETYVERTHGPTHRVFREDMV